MKEKEQTRKMSLLELVDYLQSIKIVDEVTFESKGNRYKAEFDCSASTLIKYWLNGTHCLPFHGKTKDIVIDDNIGSKASENKRIFMKVAMEEFGLTEEQAEQLWSTKNKKKKKEK